LSPASCTWTLAAPRPPGAERWPCISQLEQRPMWSLPWRCPRGFRRSMRESSAGRMPMPAGDNRCVVSRWESAEATQFLIRDQHCASQGRLPRNAPSPSPTPDKTSGSRWQPRVRRSTSWRTLDPPWNRAHPLVSSLDDPWNELDCAGQATPWPSFLRFALSTGLSRVVWTFSVAHRRRRSIETATQALALPTSQTTNGDLFPRALQSDSIRELHNLARWVTASWAIGIGRGADDRTLRTLSSIADAAHLLRVVNKNGSDLLTREIIIRRT